MIRNDSIAEYTTDYGPTEKYEDCIMPIAIPSFGENTVAQLQELAEKNRHDTYWANRREEMLSESTLIKDHIQKLEVGRELTRNKSQFGPAISVQRFHYPRQYIQRKVKDYAKTRSR